MALEKTTIKEAENALPTSSTMEYVRALDAQGNPIRINKTDLAEVLRELIGISVLSLKTETKGIDLNTFVYDFGIMLVREPVNAPVGSGNQVGVIQCFKTSGGAGYYTQIFYNTNPDIYIRQILNRGSGFGPWKLLSVTKLL